MLFQCWSTVFDAGPTLKQHWINILVVFAGTRVLRVHLMTLEMSEIELIMLMDWSQ